MPVSISLDFLRGVLGMLCVFFGYLSGRAGAAVKKGQQKRSRFYGWLIRTLACGIAISLRFRVDMIDITVWVLTLTAFILGWWAVSHERKPEDIHIFPE